MRWALDVGRWKLDVGCWAFSSRLRRDETSIEGFRLRRDEKSTEGSGGHDGGQVSSVALGRLWDKYYPRIARNYAKGDAVGSYFARFGVIGGQSRLKLGALRADPVGGRRRPWGGPPWGAWQRTTLSRKKTENMNKETRKIVKKAKERLQAAYGDRMHGLVLFGSESRGEAEPDSDLDILVLLDGPISLWEEISAITDTLYPL